MVQPVLHDQSGFVDGDGRAARGEPIETRAHFRSDARVEDGIQGRAFLGVGENAVGERFSVQLSGRGEHGGKSRDDFGEPRRSGRDDFTRHLVGVDHRHPALSEEAGDGALAGADVPGEPEHEHGLPYRTPGPSRLGLETPRCSVRPRSRRVAPSRSR